jgi:hypothetical protein
MALINLRSSLAWYDQKPGFAPNAAVNESDYKGNINDSTYFTTPKGYDNQGFATYFTPRVSANAFAIDDASHSFRGTASRKTQLGAGSRFPIGPKGQQHDFDIPRLGFHRKNRYGDLYSSLTTFGLADTYTKDSPIDDVYNIVKVRDVSYDPFGYASPPYILRGIQRDNNSKPQRWGTGNQIADTVSLALGVPRGGALAFGERVGNDVARLAKMMIRPMGLGWIAKQALLHLMNPNTEGVTGLIQRPNNHKFSNPLNTLLAAGVSGLGIHPRKHGLLPIGGLGRYEDIHTARTIQELITPGPIGQFNRLRRLTGELYNHYEAPVLPYWNTITGITGPDTVGGIGVTQFSRDVQGNLDQLLRFPGEQTSGQVVNSVQGIFSTLTPAQYLRIRRTDDSKYSSQGFVTGDEGNNSPLMLTQTTDFFKGAYAYDRDILIDRKDFPVVTNTTNPKVFLVTRGTRPDLNNNDWTIRIPTKVNVRSNSTPPVTSDPITFATLSSNTKYYRSYLNPYGVAKTGGYWNDLNESQLESRSGDTFPGIQDSDLNDDPNKLSLYSNEIAMRSIYYPDSTGNNTVRLSTIKDYYTRSGNSSLNVLSRRLYRDRNTPYGKNDGTGYSNTDTPGALNVGPDSPLKLRQAKLTSDGLNPGNDATIGKRLNDPKVNTGQADGTDAEGNAYADIRAYTAMTYPHMMMISKNRSLPSSGRSRPALLEFKRQNDGTNDPTWDKDSSPMSAYVNRANGWINGGAQTDPNFWTKEQGKARKRPISSGPNMDLITFKIGGNRFKAYITDWSDKISQTLNKFKPAGSPIDVVAGASGFERSVGVSFIVAARSHNELRTIYKGLVNLQALVKPNYIGAGAWAPSLTTLTIGDIYNGIGVYLTEMSLSIDSEYPWEIEDTEQVPMYLNVDLSFEWPNGGTIGLPAQGQTPVFEADEEEEWKIYNDDMDVEINDKAETKKAATKTDEDLAAAEIAEANNSDPTADVTNL